MIFGVTVISQQLLKNWKRKQQGKEKKRKKWKRLLRWVTRWPTIHGVINVRGVFLWQIISKVHFRPNVTEAAAASGDSYCQPAAPHLDYYSHVYIGLLHFTSTELEVSEAQWVKCAKNRSNL